MEAEDARTVRVWVGTYPATGATGAPGTGEGIWRLEVDLTTGETVAALAATSPAPSFVAVAPGALYAVGETSPGTVSCFRVGPTGELTLRDEVASGGAHPCHLLLAPDARTLYVSNYSSGTVGVLPLDADGGFAEAVVRTRAPLQVLAHSGSGPVAERQEGPHAHSTVLTPDGGHLLVLDLGTDEVHRYRRDADGTLAADGVAVTLPSGTGPRHAVFSADGRHLYLTGELSVTVHVVAWDAGPAQGRIVQTVSLGAAHGGEQDLPAHLALNGTELLVSVRGSDVVVTFALEDGLLREAGRTWVGRWPRHFAVLGDGALVLVAAERGHEVVALGPIGGGAGLRRLAAQVLPSPACVVAAR